MAFSLPQEYLAGLGGGVRNRCAAKLEYQIDVLVAMLELHYEAQRESNLVRWVAGYRNDNQIPGCCSNCRDIALRGALSHSYRQLWEDVAEEFGTAHPRLIQPPEQVQGVTEPGHVTQARWARVRRERARWFVETLLWWANQDPSPEPLPPGDEGAREQMRRDFAAVGITPR